MFDTRQAAFGSTPLGFATKEDWSFKAFAESVSLDGEPVGNQSALIGNLTGTGLEPLVPGQPVDTFMTMYPGNGSPPNSSNINVTPGRAVPNMSLLTLRCRRRRPVHDLGVQLRRDDPLPARRVRRSS